MYTNVLIWNVVLAAVMAVFVTLAGRTRTIRERPALRHCLWLLVLFKLVTPPVIPLPILGPAAEPPAASHRASSSVAIPPVRSDGDGPIVRLSAETPATAVDVQPLNVIPSSAVSSPPTQTSSVRDPGPARPFRWVWLVSSLSLSVTVLLVARVIVQLRRLSSLLNRGDRQRSDVNAMARREARRFGVRRVPIVCVVRTDITPLLWIRHARPVVVLPESLLSRMREEQLACVVTHELAHFARRDHWTNAFSCLVGCLFWWNPVVWWAQRELKIAQEACCDAMVINRTPEIRRTYAETLLEVIEVVGRGRTTPQLASGFGEAHSLTKRFEMIANERVTHRLSTWTGLLVAALMGVACCYPVLAQAPSTPEENDEIRVESHAPDGGVVLPAPSDKGREAADGGVEDGAGEVPNNVLKYEIAFEWHPKPVANVVLKLTDDGKGALTVRVDSIAQDSLVQLLAGIQASSKHVSVAELTTEIGEGDDDSIKVSFRSEPIALTSLSGAIADLSKSFRIKRVTVSLSHLGTSPMDEAKATVGPSQPTLPGRQREFWKAIMSALPGAAKSDEWESDDEAGWVIELQNYYDYTLEESKNNQSLKKAKDKPSASDGQLIGIHFEDAFRVDDFDNGKSATTKSTKFYVLKHADRGDVTKQINALKLRNADIVPDARSNRILVIGTSEQHAQVAALLAEWDRAAVKEDEAVVQTQTSPLDGNWIVERTIHGGVEHPTAEQFQSYTWSFDATARALTTTWQAKSGKSNKSVNRFVENASTTPKQLTVYGEKSLLQAIFEIDGNTLRIGMFGRSELERPSSFEAKSTSQAGPLVVFQLKRVGESTKQKD